MDGALVDLTHHAHLHRLFGIAGLIYAQRVDPEQCRLAISSQLAERLEQALADVEVLIVADDEARFPWVAPRVRDRFVGRVCVNSVHCKAAADFAVTWLKLDKANFIAGEHRAVDKRVMGGGAIMAHCSSVVEIGFLSTVPRQS